MSGSAPQIASHQMVNHQVESPQVERPQVGSPQLATPQTATPQTARLINDRLAFELLLEQGPLTRTQLRALTGLSGPTVAALVQRLEARGLVAAAGESGAERRGPNARLYAVVADRAYVAGVEVRPDVVLAVVADATGRHVGAFEVRMDPTAEPDRLVQDAVDGAVAEAGLTPDRLRTVVVGTPGLVDPVTGDVSFVATLPTWHANVLTGLRRRYQDRVLLENEVNLAGLAEHRVGAARGHDTFALLWLGTGTGAALVLGGRLLKGTSGGAGELAYLPFGPGTFQEHAGGDAVWALARAEGLVGPGDVATPDRDALARLVSSAVDGHPGGSAFLDALADRIATGAAAMCAVVDPGFLVLGGEVGRSGGADLAWRVAERLARLVPLPTEVVAGRHLGDQAGGVLAGNPVVRGAVLVALDLLRNETFAGATPRASIPG
jgi:predicted NBD/HSP70 family sugar kinase